MTASGAVKMAAVVGNEGGVWTTSPGFDVSLEIPVCQLQTRPADMAELTTYRFYYLLQLLIQVVQNIDGFMHDVMHELTVVVHLEYVDFSENS